MFGGVSPVKSGGMGVECKVMPCNAMQPQQRIYGACKELLIARR